MTASRTARSAQDLIRSARELREVLWSDPHRPRYHLVPPEGFWNDANGTIFWKGRYHIFYLGRMADPDANNASRDTWLPVWDHSSSRDLIHWIHHPPAILPSFDGSTPKGIYSGDAIENAPVPAQIYHVPGQGTCIATSDDDELIRWTPLDNPVIPMPQEPTEYVVFDPCAWREGDLYYALIGNKNRRPGFEGDCTSLFRSSDLVDWEYLHPFYKSDRRWTGEIEDCACPDFFPLGDRHMLLMHTHRPYGQCQYYLGRYENLKFYPEDHGRMTWPGGQLCAPETLVDDKGRRIFFGWIREGSREPDRTWASVMSLPRVLSLGDDGKLRIEPVNELEALRINHRRREDVLVVPESDLDLPEVRGDCLEVSLEIEPLDAREFGVEVRCSSDGEEQTPIVCSPQARTLSVELDSSSLERDIEYPSAQEAPFELKSGETLKLRIFVDRSVIEVFANRRQCLTQRIYPCRRDATGVRLFARGGRARVLSLDAWDVAPTNPW